MIENASLAHQRECRSDLSAMEQDASAFELKSPAILVIGEVAAAGQSWKCTEATDSSEPENQQVIRRGR